MPRGLCKQEAMTLGVWSTRSCVLEGLTNEGHEEVWGQRKVSASLHWAIPHTQEMWDRGLHA
jgi:hypothetical protein